MKLKKTDGQTLALVLWLAIGAIAFAFLLPIARSSGETMPLTAADITIVDGDTIKVAGHSYRLVGFDAPEIFSHAKCEAEVAKGLVTKGVLTDLVQTADRIELIRKPCSCRPGTMEGEFKCNYGRYCATLLLDNEDIGPALIHAGLAALYPYRWDAVPKKKDWCHD
jgi:endonuclease YncB( thermonuclease family)